MYLMLEFDQTPLYILNRDFRTGQFVIIVPFALKKFNFVEFSSIVSRIAREKSIRNELNQSQTTNIKRHHIHRLGIFRTISILAHAVYENRACAFTELALHNEAELTPSMLCLDLLVSIEINWLGVLLVAPLTLYSEFKRVILCLAVSEMQIRHAL